MRCGPREREQLTGQLSTDLAAGRIELAPELVTAGASSAVAAALRGPEQRPRASWNVAPRQPILISPAGCRAGRAAGGQAAGRPAALGPVPALAGDRGGGRPCRDASAKLAALSGGQFDLAYEDGDFYVIDHTDADSRRSVRTLSGGETFQASLALALALSSQMSALAAGGAARLDSIFLDEGFGTLDPETLEVVVAATLETLAQGQRMVGVITHVAALAERVPVRFIVSPGRTDLQRHTRGLRVRGRRSMTW